MHKALPGYRDIIASTTIKSQDEENAREARTSGDYESHGLPVLLFGRFGLFRKTLAKYRRKKALEVGI